MWGIELFGWILGLAIIALGVCLVGWVVLVVFACLACPIGKALDGVDRWLRAHTP